METDARGQQGWGLGWGGTRPALGQLLAVGTAPQRPPAYSRFFRQIKSLPISGISPHRITGFSHIGKERKPRRLGCGKQQGWWLQGPPWLEVGVSQRKRRPSPRPRSPSLNLTAGRGGLWSPHFWGYQAGSHTYQTQPWARASRGHGSLAGPSLLAAPRPRTMTPPLPRRDPRAWQPLPLVPAPASRVGAGRPQAHPD